MANYFQTYKIINGRLNKETLLLDDEYINKNELYGTKVGDVYAKRYKPYEK